MNMNWFEVVVGAAYEVSNTLGCGFLERVYRRGMARELAIRGVACETEVRYEIRYKGGVIGEYFADLIVDGRLVVELKCVEQFGNEHLAQCLNYLKASGLRTALLINFQRPKVEWRRIVSRF
ncbi:MAG: GxxExxY protein [Acidobacteriia bacterium]|nr:GxxExxY protein [Terriglobia bacterium]